MTEDKKKELFESIDDFVNTRRGKSKLYEIRFYVDTDTAKDRAAFFNFILNKDYYFNKNDLKRVVDLTFGSANLSTHLLLDADIPFTNLILNDKNKDDINKSVSIGTQRYSDILDVEQFSDIDKPFDLIIFNPQLGGSETYPKGVLDIESTDPVIYNIDKSPLDALNEYTDLSDCEASIDEDNKSIMIHSDILTKNVMNERFKSIKIFNYYDIFYQSKKSKLEGSHSNLIKFRKTFDQLSNDKTMIVMLADEKDFEKFFGDFNYFVEYLHSEGKRLFVGKKIAGKEKQRICYEFDGESYKINEACSLKSSYAEVENIDLSGLVKEVDEHLSYLKSIEGNELIPLKSTQGINTSEVKQSKKKLFKNFLREEY